MVRIADKRGRLLSVTDQPPYVAGAVRSVYIHRSAEATLGVVRDINLLGPLERKVEEVEVHPEDAQGGWYHLRGRVARLVPWTGDFLYTQHDVGWHSWDRRERADGWRIDGGFVVTPIDDHMCRVTHYEDYGLPHRQRWLRWPLTAYMRLTQIGEMRDLVRTVEAALPVAD